MSRRTLLVLTMLLGLASTATAVAEIRSAELLGAWVQLTGSGPEARVVTSKETCPSLVVDGRAVPMTVRAPASADFALTCAAAVPAGARAASVEGRDLPLPRPARRIVILGDTGCRVKGLTVQACNDPRAWPFAEVARLAAASKPDLVIHVGDYYYRETPCPLGLQACAGGPAGDRWDTWAAEFFDPAAPLLRAAPWVFARGNHESCARGGRGWYALLDSGPPVEGCPAVSAPFVVRSGALNLYVIDSADASDRGRDKAEIAAVAGQLDRFGATLDLGQGWIVTHRPVWGLVPVARLGPSPPFEVGLNFTQQAAFRGRALGGVQMVVSGHVHHFQGLTFGPARPAQLIVGTGGDIGEKADMETVYGGPRRVDGLDAEAFTFSRFGYYLVERDGEDWTGTFHDADDRVRAACRLHGRALSCTAVK